MLSKKAKKFIEKSNVKEIGIAMTDKKLFFSKDKVLQIIELAEEEMKEKAIEAFKTTCINSFDGECIHKCKCNDCYETKKFTDLLNC